MKTKLKTGQINRIQHWLKKGKTIRWTSERVKVGYYQVRYQRRKLITEGII